MTRSEVFEQSRKLILDNVPELADMELLEDTIINTDTAIDSMGFILIICKLEAHFGIHLPERQWRKLQTLGDVVDAIYQKLPDKA
ncbi:MAG: hypothetical protein K6C08_10455 [Oscillospiraceae bacterium]|nr:hypothetical protein [Oscillospiraceae bacterium]